ncbi:nodulation protein NodT, partial [Rhizobium sp. AC44/96]|uniref:efflux transporter outer membrane subunit n=1 Tax=Rhizobium sp. AC44/96 TaxID=1841654 RepID=UPI00080F9FD6
STVAWWTAYNDPRLNALVMEGLSENLSIQQALERINSAASNVTVAGAGSLPGLVVGASQTTSGNLGNLATTHAATNVQEGTASISWLLDLFGQYRRSKESAQASLDAAYSSADVAKLTYLQDLVTSYVNARYFQERIALSKANLKSRQETYELTKFQLEAGAASRLDVVQAEGLVQSTQAEIPNLEISFRTAAHHIATLLGKPAGDMVAELQKGSSQPVFRGGIKSGIPADLIRNRPDIRVAERNLAASTANIGVAISQLYPTISLSGSISPSYTKLAGGGAGGSIASWSFGPTLTLPIFDGGALRANVDITKSNAKADYLAWKAAVLNGVEEVENALSAVRRDAQTVEALRAQVKTTQETLELSTASYKDGASSLLDVLDAQRQVSLAQASLAAAVQQTANDFVALNVAIGGGYNPGGKPVAPPKPTPSPKAS